MIFAKNSIKLFITILVLCFSFTFFVYGVDNNKFPNSILKINSYEVINWNYKIDKFWSALVIEPGTILTNAHVVIKKDGTPYINYELCWYIGDDIKISCFTTARLLYFDLDKDLAILKFSDDHDFAPINFAEQDMQIWDPITVYWYSLDLPNNIDNSQGKVLGYYDQYVWISADINNWDSGWWAVDGQGNLVGIPTFMLLQDIWWDMKKSNYMISSKNALKFIDTRKYSHLDINYYQIPNYNDFLSYISNKQKQQSLWYIKTQDVYFLYDLHWFNLYDTTTNWIGWYTYTLKNRSKDIEIYINKYTDTNIDVKLADYTKYLGNNYDNLSISDLTSNIKTPSMTKYIKISAQDHDSLSNDTIYLFQKWEDLIHLEIYGDYTRADYKIMQRKLQNLSRMMIWR